MSITAIGLWSPAPGSGKSTVAKMIADVSGRVWVNPFAESLRLMLKPLLLQAGYTPEEAEAFMRERKEEPLEHLPGAPSARHLLRTLGTEWGRDCVSRDMWMHLWKKEAIKWTALDGIMVADDVRFPNEVDAVRSVGGEVWAVIRPGYLDTSGHRSERDLLGLATRVITNDGNLDSLRGQVLSQLVAAEVLRV